MGYAMPYEDLSVSNPGINAESPDYEAMMCFATTLLLARDDTLRDHACSVFPGNGDYVENAPSYTWATKVSTLGKDSSVNDWNPGDPRDDGRAAMRELLLPKFSEYPADTGTLWVLEEIRVGLLVTTTVKRLSPYGPASRSDMLLSYKGQLYNADHFARTNRAWDKWLTPYKQMLIKRLAVASHYDALLRGTSTTSS